ncbi:MAG: proprotein convertase P-domain-containing protein [Saprospiraceae bacterium]|nr:proprotein convertase P-domain-containing protein [Saprospiraceae bacterium]
MIELLLAFPSKRILLTLFASTLLGLSLLRGQGGGCECTNCPQFMPDLFVGPFYINVQNASNPTLGQGGQGVCGVVLHFDHTAICDISITLTSPSGQVVTLVGPIGQFCTTNGNAGTTWDVTFLPCGEPVSPDPGFANTWNSNQPWGGGNAYTGSYYPFNGCLQNFTGPVNGTWTLTVTDGQANDVGNLVDYEIIFCDPSGINCFSCAANAGNLLQSDLMACQGDPSLDLNLPPTYAAPNVAPPAAEYGYTYVVAGAGGIIQGYEPDADLTGYPAGTYTVCGMSYLLATEGNIPAPNGALTITQLSTQLNSSQPPFCGKITTNCVNVTIKPLPPDEEEFQTICAPDCFSFHNQDYCQTGTYTQTLMQNGCPYTATLYLTVNQPSFKTINETICPDGCSTTPGFAGACGAGQYTETFLNALGCDSVVTLNLINMNVVANINPNPPPQLNCVQTSAALQGTGSSAGPGVTYLWTASNGGAFSGPVNTINATITATGTYQLRVCRTVGLVTCCDSTSVVITGSQTLPPAPAAVLGPTVLCPGQTTTFTATPVNGATSYAWTLPPGATISAGQGSATITVIWGNSAGDVCIAAANACGPGGQTCLPVSVATLSNPEPPQGPGTVCQGDTTPYSIPAVAGAANYLWAVTPPAQILSGQGSPNVTVLWGNAAAGNLCVAVSNACDTSQSNCIPVQINAKPPQPDLSGDATLCAGANGTYAIPALSNATGYTWTLPPGASILSGQNTTTLQVAWTSAPGGNICVVASNGCGNGPQDCIPVTVYAVPVAQAGADAAVCDSTFTLAATPSLGSSTGAWTTLSGPGTAIFTNPSAPATGVTINQAGAYQFVWTETNGICPDADTLRIQFNDSPQIGQVQSTCDPVSQNYTITFPILGGTAPYTVPGGTVVNDTFVSNPIAGGQPYSFQVSDANGCVSQVVSGLVDCNCTTDAGQMNTPLLSACPGDSVTAQQQGGALDGDDTGAYILHTNSGPALGTVLAENTTGTFSFGAGMSYGTTYYISYVVGNALNGLPDLSDPCLSVAAGQPVVFYNNPVADAGMDVAGCGLSLTATGNPGTATGAWTLTGLPPGGTAVLSDPLAASTNLTATLFGAYTLSYTVSENGCTGSDQVILTFQPSPAAGAIVRVCDGTNQNYTVSFPILGGAAPYQVNGVPVVGSSFVSAAIPSGTAFNFVITDANGCVSPDLTGTFNCNCATSAGQVDLSPVQACAGDTISPNNLGGQNLDANDTLSYVLHTGSGPALGVILAQNHTGQFTFLPGMTYGATYYVSLAAGNNLNGFPDPADPCFSVAQGQPLVFYENPAPDAGPDTAVCGNSTTLAAGNTGFSGTWVQVSGPGTAAFAGLHDPASAVTVSQPGAYVFRWTETNGSCAAADEMTLVFSEIPAIAGVSETCNGTNTAYVLSFSVNGGTAPFAISGVSGTFAGNVFTSVDLPNNSTYNVSVTDANGCVAPGLNGSPHCPCTTSAGTMTSSTPVVFCVDQPASVVWNNDGTLDADDAVQFILHTQPGNSAGTILATNNQPVFAFGPGLQTGVTYYISAIAGNSPAGQVDLSDPCLDVAAGTPVLWKPLPSATLSGDATLCQGSSTMLSIAGTGTYPLTVTYLDGGILPVSVQLTGPQPVAVQVSPTTTTSYTLLSVSDGTLPLCTQTLSATATVTVNTPVEAGTVLAPLEFCADSNQTVALASLLSGADPGGQWTETSAKPSLPGAFQAAAGTFQTNGQAAGTYTFRYSVPALAPCLSQNATVSVILHSVPVADAGPDKTITCNQPTVNLGGSGNSTGAGISYRWVYQGDTVGNSVQLNTIHGGIYAFWVTNAAGCADGDSLTVGVDNAAPVAQRITVEPVDCFGDRNGRIAVDSVLSQHPPVLVSLNGGPFSQQTQFSPLAPGNYTVTLQDANGCEWTSGPLSVQEPQQVLVDLGPTVDAALGDSVRLNAYSNVPFSALQSIVWQPVWDSLHADTMIQHFRPLRSSRVEILVVDTSGCAASTSVLVLVDRTRNVFIPNIIKPGSTRNDILAVFGGPDVEEVEHFRIFDRWGDQLFGAEHFKPNDLSKGWDGTFKGDPVSPGVYVYYAVLRFIDGESVVFRGDVTVYR